MERILRKAKALRQANNSALRCAHMPSLNFSKLSIELFSSAVNVRYQKSLIFDIYCKVLDQRVTYKSEIMDKLFSFHKAIYKCSKCLCILFLFNLRKIFVHFVNYLDVLISCHFP